MRQRETKTCNESGPFAADEIHNAYTQFRGNKYYNPFMPNLLANTFENHHLRQIVKPIETQYKLGSPRPNHYFGDDLLLIKQLMQ